MTTTLDRIAFTSEHHTDDPYPIFPVALETGAITDPVERARPLSTPAGVVLAGGHLPNAPQAGLVVAGQKDTPKNVFAFDFAAIDVNDKQIIIHSTSKADVSADGKIMAEGVVVMNKHLQGLARITAFAVDVDLHPWLAESLAPPNYRHMGGIAVFNANPFELPEYEITEVNTNTGSVSANPRASTVYFSLL